MLGFQYVVAKSRELSSVLDRELSAASNRSAPFLSVPGISSVETATSNAPPVAPEASTASSLSVRNEGQTFLRAQQNLHAQSVSNHHQLLHSGQELDAALSHARATLQAQAASEQFLAQNFHLVSRVRQQLAGVRNLVLKVAQEAEEVENLLVQRSEESAAQQNAEFVAKQQQELENFETSIAQESEGRKRELLEMRRQKLASAFRNDLRTYQTLVAHHGDAAVAEARVVEDEKQQVTLDEVDLVVTADPEQLDAFYDSGSEQEEEELQNPRFVSPPVPNELMEEEEEKSEEKEVTEVGEKAEEEKQENAEKDVEKAAEAVDTKTSREDDASVAAGAEVVSNLLEPTDATLDASLQIQILSRSRASSKTMEAKRSAAVSESELNAASKGLHATKGTREHSDSLEYDSQVAEKLQALYEKFDGDIKAIFEELDENPRKALKYPPTSAAEFGKKYAQGFYTMAEAK